METNKNLNNTGRYYPTENKRKKPVLLIVLVIILALVAGFLSYIYFDLKQEAELNEQHLQMQKDSLTGELNELIVEYDSLKTENDSMNVLLEVEQEKIRNLLGVQASNREKIRLYEKELKTLRKIMRSYIVQIDSLNTLNQELTAENIEVKSKLKATEEKFEEEVKEKEKLSTMVEKASVLSAKNIVATPLNKRSREKDKARKVEKIRVCFTIRENKIVEPGIRTVYVRILRPDGFLMTPSAQNTFEYQGESTIFSASRELQYENQDIEMCIYYDKTEEFTEGTYQVEIYADNEMIGETSFALK